MLWWWPLLLLLLQGWVNSEKSLGSRGEHSHSDKQHTKRFYHPDEENSSEKFLSCGTIKEG